MFNSGIDFTMRLHIEQQLDFSTYPPVLASTPVRYSDAPIMRSLEALIRALASAWTLRHNSYRSPRGT